MLVFGTLTWDVGNADSRLLLYCLPFFQAILERISQKDLLLKLLDSEGNNQWFSV